MERITPQKAREYLRHNVNNYRKISLQKVNIYISEMKNGRWQLNGEPIVFDEEGILKNGQHRLAAIAKGNITIEMTVVRNVSKDVNVFDVGMNRTAMQIVNANDLEISSRITGAVSLLIDQINYPSKTAVADYTMANVNELMRANKACTAGNDKITQKAACVLASYLMLKTGMPYYEVEVFFRAFARLEENGMDGYDPSPAFVARRMFDDRFKHRSGRMVQREQLEILIMAMQDFHGKKSRKDNYRVKQPFTYEEYIRRVR